MWEFILFAGAFTIIAAFLISVVLTLYLSFSSDQDNAVATAIVACVMGLAVGAIVWANLPEPRSNIFANFAFEFSDLAATITFAFTTVTFGIATYFCVELVSGTRTGFAARSTGRKAVTVAVIIGSLLVGVLFLATNAVNAQLENLPPSFNYLALVVGGALGLFTRILAKRSKIGFFFDCTALTIIPGICWHSRIVGTDVMIFGSMGLLLGLLLYMGIDFARRASE